MYQDFIMKNLFYYATKELSQDAFLMWLIANFKTKESKSVCTCSLELLKTITRNTKILDISKADILEEPKAQIKHTDIIFSFSCDNQKYVCVIEDKIDSCLGYKQEDKYIENIINIYKDDYQFIWCFLKSGVITFDERNRLKEFNNTNKYKTYWNIIDINDLFNIFKNYQTNNDCNDILRDYSVFIAKRYDQFINYKDYPINQWRLENIEAYYNSFYEYVLTIFIPSDTRGIYGDKNKFDYFGFGLWDDNILSIPNKCSIGYSLDFSFRYLTKNRKNYGLVINVKTYDKTMTNGFKGSKPINVDFYRNGLLIKETIIDSFNKRNIPLKVTKKNKVYKYYFYTESFMDFSKIIKDSVESYIETANILNKTLIKK